MSAVTHLLAWRQKLLEQLESGSSNFSRGDMERQLAQIDAALETARHRPRSQQAITGRQSTQVMDLHPRHPARNLSAAALCAGPLAPISPAGGER
jgi:hypothetical protein